jgi:hypothetical protein
VGFGRETERPGAVVDFDFLEQIALPGQLWVRGIERGYRDEGFFAFEPYVELLLVHGDGEVSCSCPLRDGDEEVNVFECLIPFIGESSLFSSCCLASCQGKRLPSFARAAASSSGVGSVDDMMLVMMKSD